MPDCYYNGEFARRMPGAVHSRGDRRSRQGRKRLRSGIVWGWEKSIQISFG